jgi:hypothetical protein
MVHTRSIEDHVLDIPKLLVGHGQAPLILPRGPALPPPLPHPQVSIEQLLAMKNDLMRRLVENDEHRGAGRPQHHHH